MFYDVGLYGGFVDVINKFECCLQPGPSVIKLFTVAIYEFL
jgi:hypothetical protein